MDKVNPKEIMICERYKTCTDRYNQNPSEYSPTIVNKDFGYYKCSLGFGIQYSHLSTLRKIAYTQHAIRKCCWGHAYTVKKLKDIR